MHSFYLSFCHKEKLYTYRLLSTGIVKNILKYLVTIMENRKKTHRLVLLLDFMLPLSTSCLFISIIIKNNQSMIQIAKVAPTWLPHSTYTLFQILFIPTNMRCVSMKTARPCNHTTTCYNTLT